MDLTFSNIVSLFSLGLASVSLIYSIRSNTKNYELIIDYRKNVLSWYSSVIEDIVTLKHIIHDKNHEKSKKIEKLAHLSALIEKGRFYYPNVITGDSYGNEKPLAYRGYRSIPLEFLVYFYEIVKKDDADKYIDHLRFLERHFTSYLFEDLDPVSHNKKQSKFLKIKYRNDSTLEDFIEDEPKMMNIFIVL